MATCRDVLDGKARWAVECDDAKSWLGTLPDKAVHFALTSPPYFGLRSYLPDGHPDKAREVGAEPTPSEYVRTLVGVFAELHRVLRDDGVFLLNLGDSYAANRSYQVTPTKWKGLDFGKSNATKCPPGMKPKDLIGVPWTAAFALRDAGWYLRGEIVWAKGVSFTRDNRPAVEKAAYRAARKEGLPHEAAERVAKRASAKAAPFVGNPMPESVKDRVARSHETIFLFSKSPRYFWDIEAIKEEANYGASGWETKLRGECGGKFNDLDGREAFRSIIERRNARSVWVIPTKSDKAAHYAIMAPAVAEKCVLAGTSENGCCPGCGTQAVRVVSRERVPTRPGVEVKYLPKSDGDVATAEANGWNRPNVIGNRDPKRHVTKTTTVGWEASCKCGIPVGEFVPSVVADPFAGAGTTLAEAVRLGRRAVGCDLDERNIGLTQTRVGKAEVTGG